MRHMEIPEPGDGKLRVKIKWGGICGSDVEAYRGTRRPEFISFPARLGHEVAGVIDKMDPNVVCISARAICAKRAPAWRAVPAFSVEAGN